MNIHSNHYLVSSTMPLHLDDEDQSYQLFSTNYQASSATSSDLLLYHQASYSNSSTLLQSGQGSYYQEPNHLGCYEEGEKIMPSSGSWDHVGVESRRKLKVKLDWKREEGNENLQSEEGSVKWMSPKMRILHRMAVSDQSGSDIQGITTSNHSNTTVRFSLQGTSDNSGNNSSNNNNITVRVCSDCHTTKTPLWRSGPTGPKTLCNACGIRQRKARRAMAAAAASAGGTILMAAEPTHVKGTTIQSKDKKTKIKVASKKKKKSKLSIDRKKFSFEDLRISLSKNLALQQVFPQDEKEAAIMLMALSYGLLHGFPSNSYLD